MVRHVTNSGWPAATLAYAEITASLTRRIAPPRPAGIEVPNQLRVVVSDLGRLTMLDNVRWAASERPPQLAVHLEPDGPDAITLLVNDMAGGRNFTASFSAEMVSPTVIEHALERIAQDPVGILEEAEL
jgi:hypothetical protein